MAFCVACGTRLPEAARFCPSCGSEVTADAGAEETLKLVTVLFADLVSSTTRTEGMHPEDVRALMVDYFTAMAEEIVAEGGAVEKFVGDAIMAVFGVPLTHEDDAVRAVRAGRRMLARLELWNESRAPSEKLDVRIGVNTGEVLATAEARADLLVTGDAVSLAARLQESAEPGTIVIGETTSRLVGRAFELGELGPLQVKGRSEPVSACVVLGEREDVGPITQTGLTAPMVGRERELEVLRSILGRVEATRASHLVTIVGDPGVGKSRLAEEFVASLAERAKVVVGRCPAYGEGVTLRPLGEILSAEAGVLGNDPPDAAFAKIVGLVSSAVPPELAADVELTASALASTLGLEPGGELHEELDPRETRHRLVSAWKLLLTGAATEQTLVVFIEDLHWGDQLLLDVIDELASTVEGPIVFLCTARPDLFRIRPNWGGGRHDYSSVALGPLAPDDSELLVSLLLHAEQLPAPVRQSILSRAEGNPFFLEEIVRRLIDERLVERTGEHRLVREDLMRLEIPETVQGVILARIDLLPPSERRVLQESAVVGRVFWSGAVARLVDAVDVTTILRTLCERELIAERLSSSVAGETEYAFKHILTRDVAYESLPRRERARAHRGVAAWIEEMSGKRAAELTEILAYHYDVAFSLSQEDDLRVAARRNYLAASRRALRQFAIAQAEHLGRQAVRLSSEGPEHGEALEALGDLFATAHAGDAAWGAYGDSLAAFDGDRETQGRLAAKAAVQATRWYGGMTEHPSTRELERLIERGLAATGDADSAWRALLLLSRGFELAQGYTTDARTSEAAAREALAIAERLDDPNLLSGTLDSFGSLLLARGLYGQYLRFARRRIELVSRLTDVAEIGDAFVMGAWSGTYVGLYEEAVAHATACIERTRAIDPGEYVHGLSWRVWARAMTGEWTGALEDQRELERIQAETVSALPVGYTLRAYSASAFVHELRGEESQAASYLGLVEEFTHAHPVSSLDRHAALALAARALVHRGRADDARALFDDLAGLNAPPTLEALCEIVAAREDWEIAADVVESARRQAELSESHALPAFADRLEARLASVAGDPTMAASLLRRSAGGFARIGASWEEAWSRLLLAEALVELSESREARSECESALAVFDRLGSLRERERAGALVGAA
jgi:class 3 adenylate cyclase